MRPPVAKKPQPYQTILNDLERKLQTLNKPKRSIKLEIGRVKSNSNSATNYNSQHYRKKYLVCFYTQEHPRKQNRSSHRSPSSHWQRRRWAPAFCRCCRNRKAKATRDRSSMSTTATSISMWISIATHSICLENNTQSPLHKSLRTIKIGPQSQVSNNKGTRIDAALNQKLRTDSRRRKELLSDATLGWTHIKLHNNIWHQCANSNSHTNNNNNVKVVKVVVNIKNHISNWIEL